MAAGPEAPDGFRLAENTSGYGCAVAVKSAETESEKEDTEGRRCAPPLEEEKNTFLITGCLPMMLPFTLPVMLPFMLPGLHKRKGGGRVAPASKKTHPAASLAVTRPRSGRVTGGGQRCRCASPRACGARRAPQDVGGLGAAPPVIRPGGVAASPRRNSPLTKNPLRVAQGGFFPLTGPRKRLYGLRCPMTEARSIPGLWGR